MKSKTNEKFCTSIKEVIQKWEINPYIDYTLRPHQEYIPYLIVDDNGEYTEEKYNPPENTNKSTNDTNTSFQLSCTTSTSLNMDDTPSYDTMDSNMNVDQEEEEDVSVPSEFPLHSVEGLLALCIPNVKNDNIDLNSSN
jgi:hypothetical protein